MGHLATTMMASLAVVVVVVVVAVVGDGEDMVVKVCCVLFAFSLRCVVKRYRTYVCPSHDFVVRPYARKNARKNFESISFLT